MSFILTIPTKVFSLNFLYSENASFTVPSKPWPPHFSQHLSHILIIYAFLVNVLLPPHNQSIKSLLSGTFWQVVRAHEAHRPGRGSVNRSSWVSGLESIAAAAKRDPACAAAYGVVQPGEPEPHPLLELSSSCVLTASQLSMANTPGEADIAKIILKGS